MVSIRVGLLGATGQTGGSIVDGLLEAGGFSIVALTRPASLDKPANVALKERGIEIRPLDLKGSQDGMVSALKDVDVLVSAITAAEQLEQIPLATAAKTAGVKRFIPCGFITVMPVGMFLLRDLKEQVYNHIKQLYLPYTILDVGWWYQISCPPLPSGKIDYAVGLPVAPQIAGDGTVPSALTDLRDIGRYVAKIIPDERTLNKQVLVYNELWTPNQIYDLLESVSGEKVPRNYTPLQELQATADAGKEKMPSDLKDLMRPEHFPAMLAVAWSQYLISWGIRGDNTPEYAKYLGYLTSKELYPEFRGIEFEPFVKELVEGKVKPVYK